MTSTPKSIVLVHGAWHGSWCWQRVVPLLQQRGFAVRAVDLPSTGIDPPPRADLSADAAAVRKVIDEMPGDVLVCGHSYGGISQPAAPFAEQVADPAWLRTESTYIICRQDRVMPVELQRGLFAPRTARVFELEASHSPFLSRPADLAQRLAEC